MQKLAIVGTHPATRANAPFDDPAYDIWVFNEAPQADWCKRWTAVFQMHKPEVYMSTNNYSAADHWDWLQRQHDRRVIWMQDMDELVPNSRRYPLEEICARVPGASLRYFTSTPAYALALAIHLGYEQVDVYGIELSSNTEYARQLPGWMFWTGVAFGAGVNLNIYSGQEHWHDKLYGYEGEVQIDRAYFAERAEMFETSWHDSESKIRRAKDRLDAAILDRKYDKVPALLVALRDATIAGGEISGALAEAKRCAERLDPIPRQEIEKRAALAQRDGEGHRALMYHNEGTTEYVLNVWTQTGSSEALRQLRLFAANQMQNAFDLGAHLGIFRENMKYLEELDLRVDAAGGQKTLVSLGVA